MSKDRTKNGPTPKRRMSAPRAVPTPPQAPSPFAGMQARLSHMMRKNIKAVERKRKEATYKPPPPKPQRHTVWAKGRGQR